MWLKRGGYRAPGREGGREGGKEGCVGREKFCVPRVRLEGGREEGRKEGGDVRVTGRRLFWRRAQDSISNLSAIVGPAYE